MYIYRRRVSKSLRWRDHRDPRYALFSFLPPSTLSRHRDDIIDWGLTGWTDSTL